MDKSRRTSVEPGGPANINGILLQVLWTLFQSVEIRFLASSTDESGSLSEATIEVEPSAGGDLVVRRDGKRYVEQLKARSSGNAWSLQDVVTKVFPDLYLAVDLQQPDTLYRFVTESPAGRWSAAARFFASFAQRECPNKNVLEALDDVAEVRIGRKASSESKAGQKPKDTPFWELERYTERELFKKIATEITCRETTRNESDEETYHKLWHFLARFRFDGTADQESLQAKIDRALLSVIDSADELVKTRDSLLMDLLRLSKSGREQRKIKPAEFFKSHRLNAIPLSEHALIAEASSAVCRSTLQRLGYREWRDVRRASAASLLNKLSSHTPIIALAGESGCGKSWRAYGMVIESLRRGELACIVSPGKDADATITRVSETLWCDTLGHESTLRLPQIAKRFESYRSKIGPWLTVYLDGHIDAESTLDLFRLPWEGWGVRLVVAADKQHTERLEIESQGRCLVIDVPQFSESELQVFLQGFLGDDWPNIPADVRSQIHLPVLADVFRQLVASNNEKALAPQTEYELFSCFWVNADRTNPLDTQVLIHLSGQYLDAPDRYPWKPNQLPSDFDASDAVQRLRRAGWLRLSAHPTGTHFEIPHMRLMNWACAQAVVRRLDDQELDTEALGWILGAHFRGTSEGHGFRLGYVMMDVIWLMCQDKWLAASVPDLLEQLDGTDYYFLDSLYDELLPTLGDIALPHLVDRIRRACRDGYRQRKLAGAVSKIGGAGARRTAMLLLKDADPILRRSSLCIFKLCPSTKATEELWSLCNLSSEDLKPWLLDDDRDDHFLRREIHDAFYACAILDPQWIDNKIEALRESDDSASDIIYALSALDPEVGSGIWLKHKRKLFAVCPQKRLRALSTCIDRFSDKDEIPWLIKQVSSTTEMQAADAFSSLARLDPSAAIEAFDRFPAQSRYLARGWYIDLIHAKHGSRFQKKVRELLDAGNQPAWSIALVFADRPGYLEAATLEILLRELENLIEHDLEQPEWAESNPTIRLLQIAANCSSQDQMVLFQRYRGSRLERLLASMLIRIGPRGGPWQDSILREPALALLLRIGGDEYSNVIVSYLRNGSEYSHRDTIHMARSRASADAIDSLGRFLLSSSTYEHAQWDKFEAARNLMDRGHWVPVIQFVENLDNDFERKMANLVREGVRPPESLLEEIHTRVAANPVDATIGEILALGLGPSKFAETIVAAGESSDSASLKAICCVTALELCGDRSETAISFLENQLSIKKHHFAAFNALATNGTQSALEVLATDAGDEMYGPVAINLILNGANPESAIEKTRTYFVKALRDSGIHDLVSRIDHTLRYIDDVSIRNRLVDDPAIEDYLRRIAFSQRHPEIGRRTGAIRSLANINTRAAFVAAKAAMSTEDTERFQYPRLLVDLDSSSALPFLLDRLQRESDLRVKNAIARSVASLDVGTWIRESLEGCDLPRIQSALSLLAYTDATNEVYACVVRMVSQSSHPLSKAAANAIANINRRRMAIELADAFEASEDFNQRWLYLECLLGVADPGESGDIWPLERPELGEQMTPLQRQYIGQKLESKRKVF